MKIEEPSSDENCSENSLSGVYSEERESDTNSECHESEYDLKEKDSVEEAKNIIFDENVLVDGSKNNNSNSDESGKSKDDDKNYQESESVDDSGNLLVV